MRKMPSTKVLASQAFHLRLTLLFTSLVHLKDGRAKINLAYRTCLALKAIGLDRHYALSLNNLFLYELISINIRTWIPTHRVR